MNSHLKHSTVRRMLDKPCTPKRNKQSGRRLADERAWLLACKFLPPLPTIEEAPYAASNVLFGRDRRYLDDLFPSVSTNIRADADLHAHVQARWPSVTSNEHAMIETLMRAHPNISDRSLRIYLGLRRGSVPRAEW